MMFTEPNTNRQQRTAKRKGENKMENKITKIGHQSVYSIASDMINIGCYTISDIMEFGFNEEQANIILEQMKEM